MDGFHSYSYDAEGNIRQVDRTCPVNDRQKNSRPSGGCEFGACGSGFSSNGTGPLTAEQCKAINIVLSREKQFGTRKAAQMSSNTFGDATLNPFNSTFVPNLKTTDGNGLDLDWFTDLTATHWMLYRPAKNLWTFIRHRQGMPIGSSHPYEDPGESEAVKLAYFHYSCADIFYPEYMAQACGTGGGQ